MRKYEYFYDSNKVLTHIDDAFRPNIYTSIQGVEFIVRHGEKNIKHYAVKERMSALSYGFAGGGESPEHYNAKMKIVKELKYYDSILKQEVHFAKVVPEKKINEKIPDLSCYDDKDELVMLIEIKYSNEKSEEDIEKLSVNKVPTVEIDIKNDNRCKHLVLTEALEANKPRFEEVRRLSKEYNEKTQEKIRRQDNRNVGVDKAIRNCYINIDKFKEGIRGDGSTESLQIKKNIEEFREGIQTNGSKETREIERNIDKFREGIQSNGTERTREISRNIKEKDYRIGDIKQEIKRNKSTIRRNKSTIKNIDESSVEKLEAEIDRICREVEERRGNTEKIAKNCKIEWFKSSWMKSNYNNKIDEIRYWCS